jgi:hypothetical protein
MTTKKIGQGFIALGLLGILLSFLVDILPSAKTGIKFAQIAGIEISIFIQLLGASVLFSGTDDKIGIKEFTDRLAKWIVDLPVMAWVLAGFFVCYMWFFIVPVFFNGTLRMGYLIKYLPDRYPIGNDLITVLDLMKGWFLEGKSPYPAQFYPPFTYVFFAPILLVGSYPKLFMFFTLFSIAAYIILTLILPIKFGGSKTLSMVLLFFLTGLVSYGFQFELERGQYNILAFLLCLYSIYIFHNHREHRIFAYILFTLSVQLKLYPAIFIFMFVDDWKEWKIILRRFVGIGALNFALLFVMGWEIFSEFIYSTVSQMVKPVWNMDVNHSIKSFVDNLARGKLGNLPYTWQTVAERSPGAISTTLFAIFLITFMFAIVFSQSRRGKGVDTYLLLTCTIGACILPVSMDYKLSVLAAPMALFLGNLPEIKTTHHRLISIILILGISIAYSSLLIPFKYKPDFLVSAFPPLFLILIFATLLNFIQYRNTASQSTPT